MSDCFSCRDAAGFCASCAPKTLEMERERTRTNIEKVLSRYKDVAVKQALQSLSQEIDEELHWEEDE